MLHRWKARDIQNIAGDVLHHLAEGILAGLVSHHSNKIRNPTISQCLVTEHLSSRNMAFGTRRLRVTVIGKATQLTERRMIGDDPNESDTDSNA